ncbi:MAG: serine/threonine protein kinase, partial [Candidatus Binatia bacterium]
HYKTLEDTNAVLKRFVMERQILAQLQHPNIANLLDGGTTMEGLPYFVMEYVEGEPITKFCDSHAFTTDQRLELFRKVCSAMSYAHQNLIVHRDIKPSNILVTEDGTPKLLDFGIAKMLHPNWDLDTHEATATMFRVMTPEYASPEQMRGLAITTASDVYSLGVVLYELLCGERPYKVDGRMPEEIAQIVLTVEPIKPSSVVNNPRPMTNQTSIGNTEGQNTGVPKPIGIPHSAIRDLEGDLDNIILKALAKEPERRYQSVQEFSEDIRRHLVGLPVTASADTLSYRIGKFVRRHRAGVFVGGLLFVTLAAATALTSWQAVVARHERDRAEMRFNQVRKLANTVLFDYHDRIKEMPGATEVRQKMVTDSLNYLDDLAAEGPASPDLMRELAAAYRKVGDIQGDVSVGGNLGNSGAAFG